MHTTKRPRASENRIDGLARNGMDDSRFEPLIFGKRRQYGRQSARKHGFARPWRPHKNAVTARSRNLHSALSGRLPHGYRQNQALQPKQKARRNRAAAQPLSANWQARAMRAAPCAQAAPVARASALTKSLHPKLTRASGECERSMDRPHGAVEPKLPYQQAFAKRRYINLLRCRQNRRSDGQIEARPCLANGVWRQIHHHFIARHGKTAGFYSGSARARSIRRTAASGMPTMEKARQAVRDNHPRRPQESPARPQWSPNITSIAAA